MPNNKPKTKKDLEAYIRELEAKVESLSTDPSYGILTRQALEMSLQSRKEEIKFIAFLDVDYLHNFNEKFGHDEANLRIRRALHIRSSDRVLPPVKWYSGDEVALLLSGDPAAFCERQKEAFIAEGMSITIAWVEFTGDIFEDVKKAKSEVFRIKSERGVSDR